MISLLIEAIRPATYAVALAVAGWLSARSGGALWPGSWHWLVQLGLALVVAELPKYWFHRLEHEHDWLWRFHAPHHSVPRLYWLNASRFHPVDIGIDTVLGVGTLVALGCGDATIALFLVVSTVHGLFQHANLELRCGPLNWIFSMAELHRWHHSRTMAEANNNYGQNLIVWDVVFGSRYLPQDREPPRDIGLADLPNYPMGFLAQLAAPFRWRRIREQAAATPIAPLA
jgi:sterol desaturase/sphingolipid hydroxylase (fatty acid hydroxylase superfamily)